MGPAGESRKIAALGWLIEEMLAGSPGFGAGLGILENRSALMVCGRGISGIGRIWGWFGSLGITQHLDFTLKKHQGLGLI